MYIEKINGPEDVKKLNHPASVEAHYTPLAR